METTHDQSVKRWLQVSRVLAIFLFCTLVFWTVSIRPSSFGELGASIFIAVLLSLFGGYALWVNKRWLVQGAMAALLGLLITQIVTEYIVQDLRALMAIFLIQFVSYLGLLRLVDLVAPQSRIVGAIKRPIVSGALRQPSYTLTGRYVRFNLSALTMAAGTAYLLSLVVLAASYTVGGSLFAPYDVALYIIALVVALLAILTHAPRR